MKLVRIIHLNSVPVDNIHYDCFDPSVQLQFSLMDSSQSSSFVINYSCSSVYMIPFNISVNVMEKNYTIQCENGSISDTIGADCDRMVDACGYWILTNGSTLSSCPLSCISLYIPTRCPTTPATPTTPGRMQSKLFNNKYIY